MAIGQVKAKSYDYGSYARPQQVKLADTTGIGRGLISAASKVTEAVKEKQAQDKLKAEADKLKAQQEGQVEALRKKSLENVATSAETLKFISEAQTNLENMYESGELSDKEYGRLKAIEQQNYQDTIALGSALDSIEKIDFDESQLKAGDLEKMQLRNAIADGQYKIFNYDAENGASIEINYIDNEGNEQMKILSGAQALDYFGDPKKSMPRFKFNYAEDGADLLKMAGEIYNSTGMAAEDIKVDENGYKTLDRKKAAMRIAQDPELREFAKRNGARIWEDVLGGEEGSYDGSEEQLNQVVQNIAENAAASRHIKQGYGKVEPPKPGKPMTKDQREFAATEQLRNIAFNQGNMGKLAETVFGEGNVSKVGNEYSVIIGEGEDRQEVKYSPEMLFSAILGSIPTDRYSFTQGFLTGRLNEMGDQPVQATADFVPPHLRK